jgi:cephalosporin-C deacetylase-like acetyl esterase
MSKIKERNMKLIKAFRVLLSVLVLACSVSASAAKDIVLTRGWKFSTGDNPKWSEPKFNDKKWKDIEVQKGWESAGYPDYDGFGWYRIRVVIPSELREGAYVEAKKYLGLFLGAIDDADETYFNGKLIGKMGQMPPSAATAWSEDRNYRIPLDLIRWDKENVIAVRVHDSGGGGGLHRGKPVISAPSWNDFVAMRMGLAGGNGVFPFGSPMELTCNITNNALEDLTGSLVCSVRDETGAETLMEQSRELSVVRGTGVSEVFEFKAVNPGLYDVSFMYKGGGKSRSVRMYLGYGLDRIDRPSTAEKDFKAFWDKARADLAAVPPEFTVTEKPEMAANGVKVYLVEMKSLGGVRVRGWYTVPSGPGPFPAILSVPGHSSAMYPVTWLPDFAVLALNIRGHGNSRDDVNPGFPGYLISGLSNENTYIYRGAYMDCVRAVDFLMTRPEVDKKRIAVEGGSQGGALSFAEAALDPRIALCAPDVPFLSDFKTYFKITGWPGFEFKNWAAAHPAIGEDGMYKVLSYFDIMNLAPWIRCPVFMSSGLQDRTCPPTMNFAAFNKVTTKKDWRVYPYGGHEGGAGVHWAAKFDWIRTNFGMKK